MPRVSQRCTTTNVARGYMLTRVAALRRNGVHHHNLNAELALPFTKRIARLYVDMFRGSPLKTLEAAVMRVIESVLSAVVDSAPPYLRLRATQLAKATVDKIRRRTKLLHRSVRSGLESIQQSSSGFLGTFIQAQLLEGYQQASEVKCRGRFIRQQVCAARYDSCGERSLIRGSNATEHVQCLPRDEEGDALQRRRGGSGDASRRGVEGDSRRTRPGPRRDRQQGTSRPSIRRQRTEYSP